MEREEQQQNLESRLDFLFENLRVFALKLDSPTRFICYVIN